jgi:heme/copper-type cytochrome/quinol oxidase subunit 3
MLTGLHGCHVMVGACFSSFVSFVYWSVII